MIKQRKNKSILEASAKKEASIYNINKVLVALSGGADSIATAFLINRIGLQVKALHCNFHLRGEESDRDMLFVMKFCEENSIPLEIQHFNVEEYQDINPGESVEMACRNLRYKWFENQLKITGYDRIVTGHNADDNIETFFLNMLRGSGSRGLKGMQKDTGTIWRPLLTFHKKDIINYINENDLSFIVDSTNLEDDYRRNFLRNKVIPLIKSEWKGFDKALDKTISNIETENHLIEKVVSNILPHELKPFEVDKIINSPSPLLLIKRYIDPLGPFVTTPQEILAAIYAEKPHIRKWRLKKGTVFLRNRRLSIEMGHGESGS